MNVQIEQTKLNAIIQTSNKQRNAKILKSENRKEKNVKKINYNLIMDSKFKNALYGVLTILQEILFFIPYPNLISI